MTVATPIAEWILLALRTLRPPGKMTVSEWADANRVLTVTESSKPGRWRTDFTPYLRAIMDAFNDPEVEEIIFVKPTQVGGTEAMLNMMGYAMSRDPAPMLVVYPTEAMGEHISERRIQPMLRSSPTLREVWRENDSRLLELSFSGGYYVSIAGANSPTGLSSKPAKNVFLDEEEKFPVRSGKEASPASLAKERQGTFPHSKKTVRASTPVWELGPIWQAYQTADTQMECRVDCPHCNTGFVFSMKQLKWADNLTPDDAREQAAYFCPECGVQITDADKATMLPNCHWEVTRTNGSRRRLSFHLNAFYSPWKKFGDIAAKFLESCKIPEELQGFINSWLAEPFREIESQVDAEWLLDKRQSVYRRGEIAPGVVLVTGGVDVQRKSFYWTIRAWRANMTSFNVAHGQVFTWNEIEEIMNRSFTDRDGQRYQVNLCFIDSGDQTDFVYEFCAINRDWATPIKGSSARMQSRFMPRRIDRDGMMGSQLRVDIDTDAYKDMIFSRLFRDEDNGGWYLHDDCDPEYAEMICAEQKVIEQERGHLVSRWRVRASGADNHYLDCEVYAACAAEVAGIRTMHAETTRQERQENPPEWMEMPEIVPRQAASAQRETTANDWREATPVRSSATGRKSFRRR